MDNDRQIAFFGCCMLVILMFVVIPMLGAAVAVIPLVVMTVLGLDQGSLADAEYLKLHPPKTQQEILQEEQERENAYRKQAREDEEKYWAENMKIPGSDKVVSRRWPDEEYWKAHRAVQAKVFEAYPRGTGDDEMMCRTFQARWKQRYPTNEAWYNAPKLPPEQEAMELLFPETISPEENKIHLEQP